MGNERSQVIKTFCDLEAWQLARQLAILVYQETKTYPREELFGLTSQMRRSVISVMANIAEGFGRYHYKDKARFYYIGRGSLSELMNFSLISVDLNYLPESKSQEIMERSEIIRRLINGLIRCLQSRDD